MSIMYFMDINSLVGLLQQSLFVIVVFLAFLFYSMIKGRQALINVIMGLYVALLLSLKFPYYDAITKSTSQRSVIMLTIFAVFTILSVLLFTRLMPREYDEKVFESFGKKLAFALAGTALVLTFSYHSLPITEFIDPGPIKSLFAPAEYFFWWLLSPLVILFFL